MDTTDESGRQRPTCNPSSGWPRKRHWLRWTLAGGVVLVVAGGFVSLQSLVGPVPPALALAHVRPTPSGAGSSSIDGTWTVANGSSAGYRVPEEFLWQHSTLVAQTTAVTGKLVIAHAEVSSATLRFDLSAITANGKAPSGLAGILDTASRRDAVFTLTKPIVNGFTPAINQTFTASATGSLAMHWTTHLVTFGVAARYAGSHLEAAGSTPTRSSGLEHQVPVRRRGSGLRAVPAPDAPVTTMAPERHLSAFQAFGPVEPAPPVMP